MNSEGQQPGDYRKVMAKLRGTPLFIDLNDINAVEHLRNFADNKDIDISMCSYDSPDQSASRIYPLHFKITSNDGTLAREKTLGLCYYINEYYGILKDCVEVIYTGGGVECAATDDNPAENNEKSQSASAGTGKSAVDNNQTGRDNNGSCKNAKDGIPAAEVIIAIPPIVFGSPPTDLIAGINYSLARQMVRDGIKNIDIDVYHRDYFIRMPNSINSSTGRFVIPLQIKELLYMDASQIAELSKKPRAEDSLIMPMPVPEASDWFAEVLADAEKHHKKQTRLQAMLLEQGWHIPPCIRRLLWADLGHDIGLEACRITAQFHSFIKASEYEILHHIQTWARRNAYKDYQKLKAIITFAIENPQFAGCEHKLLKLFCPLGKCSMTKLINEYENPHLFEQA